MKQRVVEPELLDNLPEDHPDAIASRADLQILNRLMGNHRWILRRLRHHLEPGWRILEIGAGDGILGARIVESGLCAAQDLFAIDWAERPVAWPAGARWLQQDLLDQPLPEAEVIIANLVLHHFQNDQLRQIGRRIPDATRLLLTVDPARRWLPAWTGAWFCRLAELNRVTSYDMQVSIRAGFRGQELPAALGLSEIDGWECRTTNSSLGACRLEAVKSSCAPGTSIPTPAGGNAASAPSFGT